MRVIGIWRYPVKSFQGEALEEAALVAAGVEGDRSYGVFDVERGLVASAKRDGRLLEASAALTPDGLRVSFPGGQTLGAGEELDAALSSWRARASRLVAVADFGPAVFENIDDVEDEASSTHTWAGPPDSFVDGKPLHLLGTRELARYRAARPELDWDVRRFRPNLVVEDDDAPIDALESGTRLRAGSAVIAIHGPCKRCVMPTRPQPGGLGRELDLYRHLGAVNDYCAGVLATVEEPGRLATGEELRPV